MTPGMLKPEPPAPWHHDFDGHGTPVTVEWGLMSRILPKSAQATRARRAWFSGRGRAARPCRSREEGGQRLPCRSTGRGRTIPRACRSGRTARGPSRPSLPSCDAPRCDQPRRTWTERCPVGRAPWARPAGQRRGGRGRGVVGPEVSPPLRMRAVLGHLRTLRVRVRPSPARPCSWSRGLARARTRGWGRV